MSLSFMYDCPVEKKIKSLYCYLPSFPFFFFLFFTSMSYNNNTCDDCGAYIADGFYREHRNVCTRKFVFIPPPVNLKSTAPRGHGKPIASSSSPALRHITPKTVTTTMSYSAAVKPAKEDDKPVYYYLVTNLPKDSKDRQEGMAVLDVAKPRPDDIRVVSAAVYPIIDTVTRFVNRHRRHVDSKAHVLILTNTNETCDKADLIPLINLAKEYSATKVHIIHVGSSPLETEGMLLGICKMFRGNYLKVPELVAADVVERVKAWVV